LPQTTSEKVLTILELFRDTRVTWTVEEAAIELDLPISSTYRYFKTLSDFKLITTYVTGRYVLGPAIIEYDRRLKRTDPLIAAADEEMKELGEKIGGAMNILLARAYHYQVMCVHFLSYGDLPFALGYERGKRMPLDRGATGKIILANMSSSSIAQALGNRNSNIEEMPDSFMQQLKDFRKQGYAITDGEISVGARGISVPIFSPEQKLEGSLTLAISHDRDDLEAMIIPLIRCRKSIEANLEIGLLNIDSND